MASEWKLYVAGVCVRKNQSRFAQELNLSTKSQAWICKEIWMCVYQQLDIRQGGN